MEPAHHAGVGECYDIVFGSQQFHPQQNESCGLHLPHLVNHLLLGFNIVSHVSSPLFCIENLSLEQRHAMVQDGMCKGFWESSLAAKQGRGRMPTVLVQP